MLVLSRRPDESIILGNGLAAITVVDVVGDKVRIGITAPKHMAVHRSEVQRAISKSGTALPAASMWDHGRLIAGDGREFERALLLDCPSDDYLRRTLESGFVQFRPTINMQGA